MKATERLYFTADKSRLVREGDRAAAFLYAAEGDEIPESAAERFELEDGALSKRAAKQKAPAGDPESESGAGKQSAKGEDKQAGKGEDKSGGGLKIHKKSKG